MRKLKTIYAGSLILRTLSDRPSRGDKAKPRAAKQHATRDAVRRMNQIYSAQQLEFLLAANFPTAGSALVVTLTFDEAHKRRDRAQTQRAVKYFLARLRKARKAADMPEPVAFWAPEALTAESGRWHVHAVIDATGDDLTMLRACWIYGALEAEPLRVDAEKNHESLARYISKELREAQDYGSKPGLHGWSCTRNARRPEVETREVPDDFELDVPQGAIELLNEGRSTVWASWRVQKLRLPRAAFPRRPRVKRKRPRRALL